jgi:histidinol-phosphate phosphatase family protein
MGNEPMNERALFLDRDGTINFDRVYINDPSLIELIPGVAKAIASANARGWKVIVVTNQSGVGRGLIAAEKLPLIHARLDKLLLEEAGAKVDSYRICPHQPDDGCDCRKPGVALVMQAAEEFAIDLQKSYFVGDAWSDIACGNRAGTKTVLVRTGKGKETELGLSQDKWGALRADSIADDLAIALREIFQDQ